MLKGINQCCFPPGTSVEEVFAISKEAGFDAVELNLNEPSEVGLTMDTSAKEALEIKKMANEIGLQLRTLSTTLLWKSPLSSSNETVREDGKKSCP